MNKNINKWTRLYNNSINNKEIEILLPTYLKEDIERLCIGYDTKSSLLDCYYDEVVGSINSAQHDSVISKDEADYLRKKYLGY